MVPQPLHANPAGHYQPAAARNYCEGRFSHQLGKEFILGWVSKAGKHLRTGRLFPYSLLQDSGSHLRFPIGSQGSTSTLAWVTQSEASPASPPSISLITLSYRGY